MKYVELGWRITKVHRALAFDEAPWMKTYVERNIEKRKQARNSLEKDFWKLANNSVFGKTCENVMNRVDVRLVRERKKALRQILKPNYKQHTIYNEDLVGILMGLNKVKLNKPSYVGVAILDLSKILMYDFYYDFVQPTWGPRAGVLFTDTDSLALQVHTEDLYKDIEPHVVSWFDTSKLKPGNPQGLPPGKKLWNRRKIQRRGAERCNLRVCRNSCKELRLHDAQWDQEKEGQGNQEGGHPKGDHLW